MNRGALATALRGGAPGPAPGCCPLGAIVPGCVGCEAMTGTPAGPIAPGGRTYPGGGGTPRSQKGVAVGFGCATAAAAVVACELGPGAIAWAAGITWLTPNGWC